MQNAQESFYRQNPFVLSMTGVAPEERWSADSSFSNATGNGDISVTGELFIRPVGEPDLLWFIKKPGIYNSPYSYIENAD